MSDKNQITFSDPTWGGEEPVVRTLTAEQVAHMLYTIEYLAVCNQDNFTLVQKKAIACLTEQGRAPVTIPVGAIVEAI